MIEEKPTSQQLAYISSIREHSEFPMPEFKGTTKREASEYIEKFNLISHESSEIVRCEDCKRSYEVINGLNELQLRCKHWLDDDTPYIVIPNGFCAWGERKEANDGRI